MHGIVSTTTGYIGGTHKYPTFQEVYDHTEAICIEYDPKFISYWDILNMWRDNDDPFTPDCVRYRSVVYVFNYTQYKQAKEFLYHVSMEKPHCYMFSTIEWIHSPTTISSTSSRATSSSHRHHQQPQQQQQQKRQQLLTFYVAEEMHQDYVIKEWEMAKRHLLAWANEQTKSGLFPISE